MVDVQRYAHVMKVVRASARQMVRADGVTFILRVHAQPAVIPDIYADPRVPADAYRPTFVRSMAMVPIGRETPLGAIGAYWAHHHEATEDQLEILRTLADSALLQTGDHSAETSLHACQR
jgi:hypothetical protein